jgi:hypothetical protein
MRQPDFPPGAGALGYSGAAVGRARFAAAVGFVCGGLICAAARADTGLSDVLREPATTPTAASAGWAQKLAGSALELSSYVGTGSFYVSGYRDPYASVAVFARPTYDLGTRFKLSLNARIYAELEMTAPDNSEGRHLYPYDPWLWLAAQNLHTFERAKLRLGGLLRSILPLSYESRYQHLLFGVGAGFNLSRPFELGHAADKSHQWTLSLTYSFIGYKFFHSSNFPGTGPNDTGGCRAAGGGAPAGASVSGGEPAAAPFDHCSAVNPDFTFQNAFIAALARGKLSLTTTLIIINVFDYTIPADGYTSALASVSGRNDMTWGIVAVGYQLRPRIGLSAGISSLQPALDARQQSPRFPFFDFSGANADNYTQFFASVNGTL